MGTQYLDSNKTPQERAAALLAELSLDEKMAQVNCIFPFGETYTADLLFPIYRFALSGKSIHSFLLCQPCVRNSVISHAKCHRVMILQCFYIQNEIYLSLQRVRVQMFRVIFVWRPCRLIPTRNIHPRTGGRR